MNNENNNSTVLGSTTPNPVPNPVPENGVENLGSVVNPNQGINNTNGVNPIPTPINPTPVTPEPIPEPVVPDVNQNINPSPVVNGGTINNNPINNNVPNIEPTMASQPVEPSVEVPAQPPVAPSMDAPIPPQPSMENNSVPPVVPQPAYTNPQTINQNTIGTTPPISYEPEKKPKAKNNNKILFIIIIVLVLAVVGFGTYYVLKYTDLLNNNAKDVTITTKNLEFNMGNELSSNVADYAEISGTEYTNCNVDYGNIDINKAGVYEYTVSCGEVKKSGKITILDTTSLKVTLTDVYKVKGDDLDVKEFAQANTNYNYEFVEAAEVEKYLDSEPGTYPIKIKVTDNATNKSVEVDGNLIILSYPLKGFLTCSSKEQNVENYSAKMIVNEKFAILNGGTIANAYGNLTYEIYTFSFTDEQEFTKLLDEYNNSGTVNINNITGNTEIDESKKTITITNLRKNEEVIAEYGADNLKSYDTIKKYFNGDPANNTQGLGYDCKYEKKQ